MTIKITRIDNQDPAIPVHSAQTQTAEKGGGQKNLNRLIRSRSYHKTEGTSKNWHKLERKHVRMREHSDSLFFTIYTGHRKRISDRRPLVALTNRPTGKEVETLPPIAQQFPELNRPSRNVLSLLFHPICTTSARPAPSVDSVLTRAAGSSP